MTFSPLFKTNLHLPSLPHSKELCRVRSILLTKTRKTETGGIFGTNSLLQPNGNCEVPKFSWRSDLQLIRDGITFLVACKRPANEHSIHANIHDAIEQLQENFNNAPPGAFGIAAINISCVFNSGNQVFSGDMKALGNLLEKELDKHKGYLVSVDDPRICCVMFDVATPSVGGQNVDLVRASYSVAQELKHPSIGSKTFKEHARDMGSRTKH